AEHGLLGRHIVRWLTPEILAGRFRREFGMPTVIDDCHLTRPSSLPDRAHPIDDWFYPRGTTDSACRTGMTSTVARPRTRVQLPLRHPPVRDRSEASRTAMRRT